MRLIRSTVGLTTMAVALLLAQSPDETRAKETALKNALFALRTAIDMYTFDQKQAPRRLGDLIAKEYLSGIPVDPMAGNNSSWRIVTEDPAKPGIFDVHSSSEGVSSDGTRYADW